MCGLAGVLGRFGEEPARILSAMARTLTHRGPDAYGVWVDSTASFGLSHTRLAILDVSQAGAQPMVSHDGRLVLAFNGEIYNHISIRRELDRISNRPWRGASDTEVMLEAIREFGVERALTRFEGMFAFALWDCEQRELVLARDRMGEKPLYVGWLPGAIVFASELRALRVHPSWRGGVDPLARALMVRIGYVPAPLSIHPAVFKLPAASFLRLRVADATSQPTCKEFVSLCTRYWTLENVATSAKKHRLQWKESLDRLQELIDESVRERMIADVPIGAFLSGGIDSGIVVASMQHQSSRPVRTFTVRFQERDVDESSCAKQVAMHLGTEHTEVCLSPREALSLIERLPTIYDEPFADPAQLPAVMLAQAARPFITVALTGDGGDELFGGYQRYIDAKRMWRYLQPLPVSIRKGLAGTAALLARVPTTSSLRMSLRRQQTRLEARDFDDYYARLISFGEVPGTPSSPVRSNPLIWPGSHPALSDPIARMRLIDQRLGLPEGIHTKLDRASMASSLELRIPLLDSRLIAFSWSLPDEWLTHGQTGKKPLRDLFSRRLPIELAKRRKQGLDVPVAQWLRGPLFQWADDLLSSGERDDDPLLDVRRLRTMLDEHTAGRADHGFSLWAVCMYRQWQDRNTRP